jgi:hypothetical protein
VTLWDRNWVVALKSLSGKKKMKQWSEHICTKTSAAHLVWLLSMHPQSSAHSSDSSAEEKLAAFRRSVWYCVWMCMVYVLYIWPIWGCPKIGVTHSTQIIRTC